MEVNTPESFWARVVKGDGCWLLPSKTLQPSTASTGRYRMLSVRGRQVLAHRFAYEIAVGPIPAGKQVLHRCDNRGCVRPAHLFLGTAKDNAADRIAKGRTRGARAEVDYILRGIPEDLMRLVKMTAAMNGESVRHAMFRFLYEYSKDAESRGADFLKDTE